MRTGRMIYEAKRRLRRRRIVRNLKHRIRILELTKEWNPLQSLVRKVQKQEELLAEWSRQNMVLIKREEELKEKARVAETDLAARKNEVHNLMKILQDSRNKMAREYNEQGNALIEARQELSEQKRERARAHRKVRALEELVMLYIGDR